MSNWTPRNKKTGIEYPPVSDAEKAAMESDPATKGKYTFKPTADESPKQPTKPKAEKEKLTPIGVEPPNEPNEEKEQA